MKRIIDLSIAQNSELLRLLESNTLPNMPPGDESGPQEYKQFLLHYIFDLTTICQMVQGQDSLVYNLAELGAYVLRNDTTEINAKTILAVLNHVLQILKFQYLLDQIQSQITAQDVASMNDMVNLVTYEQALLPFSRQLVDMARIFPHIAKELDFPALSAQMSTAIESIILHDADKVWDSLRWLSIAITRRDSVLDLPNTSKYYQLDISPVEFSKAILSLANYLIMIVNRTINLPITPNTIYTTFPREVSHILDYALNLNSYPFSIAAIIHTLILNSLKATETLINDHLLPVNEYPIRVFVTKPTADMDLIHITNFATQAQAKTLQEKLQEYLTLTQSDSYIYERKNGLKLAIAVADITYTIEPSSYPDLYIIHVNIPVLKEQATVPSLV